jgi:GT2 family glycosyltransferase
MESSGEISAIIDDDAYPVKDWLKNAIHHFNDPAVAAVGGPAVTPPSDSLSKKISGWIYESPLVSSKFIYRYKPSPIQDVDDYPTCNLIIRKSNFIEAGGFETGYWPGEDTILCLKLTHKLGKRIVYDPGVKVFHHRRNIFGPHLSQIKSYAFHRGFFVKKFPETSLKPAYFIPSVFMVFALLGWTSVFLNDLLFLSWAAIMGIYTLLNLAFSLRTWNPIGILGIFTGTFLTHIFYGVWFIAGLLVSEIKD